MNRLISTNVTVILTIIIIITCGCSGTSKRTLVDFDAVKSQLCEGDLLFRRGTGVVGHIVVAADDSGNYSHVGMAVLRDGEWCVVHAVPDEPDFKGDVDRVKCEPIEQFWSIYRAANGCHYHVELHDSIVDIAVRNALRLYNNKTLFDDDYDHTDTTKLYCTEFIEYVYSLGGVSLSEGRRSKMTMAVMSGDYIMPSDIAKNANLKPIYSF